MNSLSDADECKTITYDEILKLKGNEKNYQDAMEASSAFNRRLIKDRKMRVPFLDSQTRVAQTNNTFTVSSYQRKSIQNSENNFIYEYPVRKWFKQRRLNIDPYDPSLFPNAVPIKLQNDENFNNVIETTSLPQHQTSNSSLTQILKNEPEQDESQHVGHSSTVVTSVYHEDSFDNEDNDDSDDNDYEDTKKKRKKNAKSRKKAEQAPVGDDKPYACDRCGMKYKTKPGLTYHIQKAHTSQSNLTHNNSGFLNQNSVKSDSMNPDENTNSMLGYDDMNSSSSVHHGQLNSTSTNMSLPQPQHYQQQQQQQYQYHHS